jgi:MFS family permease
MGVGGEWAAGHALVAETFPPAVRGRAGAILQTGAPIGVGIAALVGTLVAPSIGWRACLIGSSATALLAFIARRGMPESDLWESGRAAKIVDSVGSLFAGAHAGRFYLAFVLTVLNGASYWLTYSWLPEYLRSRGLSLGASGTFLGVIVSGEIVGYTVFGVLSDRIGRRPAFTIFATIMAVGLIPLTVAWERVSELPLLLYGATVLVGIGSGTWSNFGPFLAELFPTEVRTTSMGTILNLSRAVQFGAPVLIALLEPKYGLASGIGLAALFAAAAGLFVWVLPETKSAVLTRTL